jgi:ATP-dependent helicase/nuclease subunit B
MVAKTADLKRAVLRARSGPDSFLESGAMTIERLAIATDSTFWLAASCAVRDFAQRLDLPARQLQALTWLVPGGEHAVLARKALHGALGNVACVPPRIVPLAAWLGMPLRRGTAARAELFTALRANDWIRAHFGNQPAALWSLAAGIAQLCDELDWVAAAAPEAVERAIEASLARHYRRRAAHALQPQAQLVLQLWRAQRDADLGPGAALRELQRRADSARDPLVFVAPLRRAGETDWRDAFVARYAKRAPVLWIEPRVSQALAAQPLLAAAWPELTETGDAPPIAARAAAVCGAGPGPLTIVQAEGLEEEGNAVAQQVLDWCRAGVPSIGLVVLDRLTARRVRALLERAQVAVRDETGWKLSTTSAAAAIMRWFDLVSDDLYWRDLLDWLKSAFTFAARQTKDEEVAQLERAIRKAGVIQGAGAMRRALLEWEPEGAATRGALELLQAIEAQMIQTRRAPPRFAAHAAALRATLDALDMRAALSADVVGAQVLQQLDVLEAELAPARGRATLVEFRAVLAAHFEEAAFVDTQFDSPVVMVSLGATPLRPFHAALLIGADARRLPAPPAELLFMSNTVRAELGLPTADAVLARQEAQLAALLCTVPRVVATWRARDGEEPNVVSPLLERLQFVAQRACGDKLVRAAARQTLEVDPRPVERPAPRAPAMLPPRLSASAAQSLVDCAYRFYARYLLRLAELEDVPESPDKRDYGEALHEVLRRFHRACGPTAFHEIEAATLAARLRATANEVFDPLLETAPAMLSFQRRFDGLVPAYIAWLQERSRDGWRWLAAEEMHAQPLALGPGAAIELYGRVDRIDWCGAEQELIDYKARAAGALAKRLSEAGEDVQLPFYGLLLGRRARAASYLAFERARDGEGGVTGVPAPEFEPSMDALEARLADDLQRIAAGAAMPALGAATVCAYCEMRGLCRRGHWDDDEEAEAGIDAMPGAGA